MSDTVIDSTNVPDDPATPDTSSAPGDERLAYRGVFQRVFVRPEIGAIIGALAIWVFFWAVAGSFGTANGFAGVLDVSATLGIMAVAVSMLMIGGEFDLSSGAATGTMGILVILIVKETGDLGGFGLSLWIGIPLSFLIAMGIGFSNGWMVEKTALPSFIVTLGTFFVLKGAKLGFSKLIVDQIQVGRTDEGHGYDFWQPIFSGEWDRTLHQFEGRDTVYSIAVIGGLCLLVLAVCEMYFSDRDHKKPAGMIQFVVGVVGAVAGAVVLHTTDSVSGNWLGAIVIGAGTIVGLIGLGIWRFRPAGDRGSVLFTTEVVRPLAGGVVALGLSVVAARVFDSSDATDLFFPFTEQGLRATLFGLFAGAGLTMLIVAGAHAKRVSIMTKTIISMITAVAIVGLAFFVRAESESVKFRSEAFSVMLVIALLVAAWAIMGLFFDERLSTDHSADKRGTWLVVAGLVFILIGFTCKLLFTTDDEVLAGVSPAKFSMRILWFVSFTAVMVYVLGRTRFGSWTFAVGGNKDAARQVGVPAARTKTQLFMLVSGAAWLVGMLLAFRLNTIQAGTGDGLEFQYIIAAVVGGTLLTGGYGTALGGAIGAIIMSMSQLGIPASRWNSDWFFLFLGVILLGAVIANRSIRNKAEGIRR